MELLEMLSTKPAEYLHSGFFYSNGELREGINGFFSLGMAYRCREEGINADKLKRIVTRLEDLAKPQGDAVVRNPEEALDASTFEALTNLQSVPELSSSNVVKELLEAACPWVQDWKNYAALVIHIDRMTSQLAILTSLPKS